MKLTMLTAVWLLAAVAVSSGTKVQVRLQQGVIEGMKEESDEGRAFYSFKNIPFAQPPVGDLRFKDPVPAGPWSEVRNGSLPTPKCPQIDLLAVLSGNSGVDGEEDCLYLSVYTPRPYVSDLPVMVWIHGGAFVAGSSEEYSPLPILNKDVVLVTIQYRLGIFGFLSTEDSTIPGNMGLKDQTLALRWVKDNIQDLGGDPNEVTIFGESAGGAAVHYQILSPMAKGLFKRAIVQSGTSLCPWAYRKDHREVAAEIAEKFNCSTDEEDPLKDVDLAACLSDASIEDLLETQNSFAIWNFNPTVMVPNVDGEFLPDTPEILLREGKYNKVDIMMGITQHEGAMFTRLLLGDNLGLVENFTTNGPIALGFGPWEDDPEYLAKRSFYRYVERLETMGENEESLIQLFSDRMFKMCHLDAVQFHVQDTGKNLYTYELQHLGEHDVFGEFFPSDLPRQWIGHAEDLMYLFDSILKNETLSRSDDLFVQELMVDMWTNFAIKGHPTPDFSLGFRWRPMSESENAYLSITTVPEMKDFNVQEVEEFWRDMPLKSNKLLYPERFSMRFPPPPAFPKPPRKHHDFDLSYFFWYK